MPSVTVTKRVQFYTSEPTLHPTNRHRNCRLKGTSFFDMAEMGVMFKKVHVTFFSLALAFVALNAVAQDDEDRRRRRRDEAINTKQESPVKIIEFIVGIWDIASVYKNDRNITGADTLVGFTRIRFNRENQYRTFRNGEEIDSGTFRLNENHSILYLESAFGGEPATWNVAFDGNLMSLVPGGTTSAFSKSFRYVYIRREE